MRYPEGFSKAEIEFMENVIPSLQHISMWHMSEAYNFMFNVKLSEQEFRDRFNDYCSQLNETEDEDDLLDRFIADVADFGSKVFPVSGTFFDCLPDDDAASVLKGIISEYQNYVREKSDKIQDEIRPTVSSFTNFVDDFQKMIKEFIR